MASRNPRIDPSAGDLLKSLDGRWQVQVKSVHGEDVFYWIDGDLREMTIEAWRKKMKAADIVK